MKIQDQKAKLSGASQAIAAVMRENEALRTQLCLAERELQRAAKMFGEHVYVHSYVAGSDRYTKATDYFMANAKRISEVLADG